MGLALVDPGRFPFMRTASLSLLTIVCLMLAITPAMADYSL